MVLDYNNAKKMLLTSDIDGCQRFFKQNNYPLEYGYCCLMDDNLDEAEDIFLTIKEQDKRAAWALFLTKLLDNRINGYPTYFELRNFLEIDLNIFINAYKGEYVEKIISYADFFFTINPEVYKFIGRVFLNNKLDQYGLFFLLKAKDCFYNDPELHYLLAEYYFDKKLFNDCKKSIGSCLGILPEYFPAKTLLKKLNTAV